MTRWFHLHFPRSDQTKTTRHFFAQDRYVQQYRLVREIGYGSSGVVHLAVDRKTRVRYAIKELSKSKLRRQQQRDLLTRSADHFNAKCRRVQGPILYEIDIMKTLEHPYVGRLHQVIDDPDNDSIYLVMELAEKGAVMEMSSGSNARALSQETCRKYFGQLVEAIDYVHQYDIIHGDIKPSNLLVTRKDTIMVVDFGSAVRKDQGSERMPSSAGTPAFMAPEVLDTASFAASSPTASDIWSMGVTLYCLCTGHLPFQKQSLLDLYQQIKNDNVIYPEDLTDPDLRDLLDRMLAKDPSQRITIDEIKKHPWLSKQHAKVS